MARLTASTNGATKGVTTPTKQERDRAVKLYTETRLPVGEIADHLHVSRQTVHRWLKDAGIELRGPMGPRDSYPDIGGVTDTITLAELEAGRDAILRSLTDCTGALNRLIGLVEAHVSLVRDEARAATREREEIRANQTEILRLLKEP